MLPGRLAVRGRGGCRSIASRGVDRFAPTTRRHAFPAVPRERADSPNQGWVFGFIGVGFERGSERDPDV